MAGSSSSTSSSAAAAAASTWEEADGEFYQEGFLPSLGQQQQHSLSSTLDGSGSLDTVIHWPTPPAKETASSGILAAAVSC